MDGAEPATLPNHCSKLRYGNQRPKSSCGLVREEMPNPSVLVRILLNRATHVHDRHISRINDLLYSPRRRRSDSAFLVVLGRPFSVPECPSNNRGTAQGHPAVIDGPQADACHFRQDRTEIAADFEKFRLWVVVDLHSKSTGDLLPPWQIASFAQRWIPANVIPCLRHRWRASGRRLPGSLP